MLSTWNGPSTPSESPTAASKTLPRFTHFHPFYSRLFHVLYLELTILTCNTDPHPHVLLKLQRHHPLHHQHGCRRHHHWELSIWRETLVRVPNTIHRGNCRQNQQDACSAWDQHLVGEPRLWAQDPQVRWSEPSPQEHGFRSQAPPHPARQCQVNEAEKVRGWNLILPRVSLFFNPPLEERKKRRKNKIILIWFNNVIGDDGICSRWLVVCLPHGHFLLLLFIVFFYFRLWFFILHSVFLGVFGLQFGKAHKQICLPQWMGIKKWCCQFVQ